jgi:hypothetical protein
VENSKVGSRVKALAALNTAQGFPVAMGRVGKVVKSYKTATNIHCTSKNASYVGFVVIMWDGDIYPHIFYALANLAFLCPERE